MITKGSRIRDAFGNDREVGEVEGSIIRFVGGGWTHISYVDTNRRGQHRVNPRR